MTTVPETTRPVVLGYYPSWPCGLEPAQIDYRAFTHICHAFVTADTSGSLKTTGNLPSRDLTRRAHEAGTKVLLSVGGADSGAYMGPIARDPDRRARFIATIARMVADNGYDGVDLDWEFPMNPRERDALTTMARGLRAEMAKDNPSALLTGAFSGSAWASRHVDAAALLPLLDFVNIMTYDVHGPWSDHSGYNAPLHPVAGDRDACARNCLEGQMRHWNEDLGWPREKLIVGIPCYGRGFAVSRWHDSPTTGTKAKHPYLPFKNVAGMIHDGWVSRRDDAAGVPWLSKEGVKELISYDDEASARAKGRWAAKNGYGGVFFWEISQDLAGGRNAIVGAATEGFTGKK